MSVLGQKRASWALMGSGFVLSVPVFFDTVFYLLVPLARSMYRRTQRHYLLYLLAIVAGAAVTHTMVPPTPGPLFMAAELKIDIGLMMMVGGADWTSHGRGRTDRLPIIDRLMPLEMRPYPGEEQTKTVPDDQLPPLWLSLLPVVLPIVLMASNTVVTAIGSDTAKWQQVGRITAVFGNRDLALLVSAGIAIGILVIWPRLSLKDLGKSIESALMSGGVIILITAGGGAFGKALSDAGIKDAIAGWVDPGTATGLVFVLSAFAVASLVKFAQGSGTVAMITTVGIFAGLEPTATTLGFHPVYVATAIGSGSLIGDWMNNSGFWIFAKMGGLSELETLKSWTILTAVLGITGLGMTLLLARVLPMAGG